MTAIDKIRAIAKWADAMNEDFNHKVRSMSDWEVLYDTMRKENWAYADNLDSSDPDERKSMKITNAALGYKLYEV